MEGLRASRWVFLEKIACQQEKHIYASKQNVAQIYKQRGKRSSWGVAGRDERAGTVFFWFVNS